MVGSINNLNSGNIFAFRDHSENITGDEGFFIFVSEI